MADAVKITAPDRYLRVLRADGSQLSRHPNVEDAIEAAVNAPPGVYRIVYPDRIVKVYGSLASSQAPAAPTELTANTVTAGYVTLSWTDDGTGTSWTVYRNGVPIGTASTQQYRDSTVVPSTAYSYQVQASSSSGASVLSDAVAVTTAANTPPVWGGLNNQTLSTGSAATINLAASCEDFDEQPLTYLLVSGSVPGMALSVASYTGTPTTVGVYPLTFRANDGYASTDVLVTYTVVDPDVTAPTTPTGVSASVGGSTVTLNWTPSTDTESGVANYRVYRDGAFRGTVGAPPYVESGLAAGTYSYRVSAVDGSANANESAQSSPASAVVSPAAPDTPINFTATRISATQINLSWAAGPNGAVPTDYDLDFSTTSASGPWTPISIGLVTSYSHTGINADIVRYYRLRANTATLSSSYATLTYLGAADFIIPASTATRVISNATTTAYGSTSWASLATGGKTKPNPGDVIEFAAGTHGETEVRLVGSSTADIFVKASTSARSTFSAAATWVLTYQDCSYMTIDGGAIGSQYGFLVTAPSANSGVGHFVKCKGVNHHVTLRNIEVDGLVTNFAGSPAAAIPIGIGLHDNAELMSGNPNGTFQHHITLENFYVRRVRGEGVYAGPNWQTQAVPMSDITIRNGVIEDCGRDGVQGKAWYEGDNLIEYVTCRRVGRNRTDAQSGQLLGIDIASGQGTIRYCKVYDAGESGIRGYVDDGPYQNRTFNGHGPYSQFDVEIYGNLIARTGRARAPRDITGISRASQAVVQSTAHGLVTGGQVTFASVGGMTQINGQTGTITATTTNSFTVSINSSAYSTYTSGGTATPVTNAVQGHGVSVGASSPSTGEPSYTPGSICVPPYGKVYSNTIYRPNNNAVNFNAQAAGGFVRNNIFADLSSSATSVPGNVTVAGNYTVTAGAVATTFADPSATEDLTTTGQNATQPDDYDLLIARPVGSGSTLGTNVSLLDLDGDTRVLADADSGAYEYASGPEWQLADGHFIPAKMAPVIVGPSPNTEAGTDAAWSRYRRAPSAIPYRVPIAVLGGAYPFHYEIVTGPSGMTIGADVGDSDYGILSWASPTIGSHSITVKITDQDGTEATRSWTLQVLDRESATYFVFVNAATGSNSNSGAYSAPKQNFLGWYGGNISDSTHAGKQVFYFAGTYATTIISDPSGVKFWLNPSYKPSVHVAIPGQTVTFDCATYYFGGMRQDFCVSGISHINGVASEGGLTRMTYYRNDNGPGRNLFFENTFGPATGTPSGGSNSGSIMFDGDESYCVVSHNTFTHTADTFVLVYQAKNSVFQHNDCRPPGTNGNGLFLKSSGYDNWSIRANYGYGSEHFMVLQDGIQSEPNHDIYNLEICWNSYRCTGGSPIEFAESSGASGGPIWIYRNSFSGTADIPHNMFNAALTNPVGVYEKNILQGVALLADAGSNPDVFNFSNDSPSQTDVTGWLNASTNLLEGSGLAYLGTHGAEIA